ncbi:uncharacterized protein RAG0_16575 [Rhynchosporium agropyri]|uniref:Uncharacterized protein n=1 Tax=Rhynchosporium agropyri TaxID=914238 RepID=A0A1E1LR35_9HELO|nr:uncharacterized protein RAG0_16575 [Rhynchosporium agropyri]
MAQQKLGLTCILIPMNLLPLFFSHATKRFGGYGTRSPNVIEGIFNSLQTGELAIQNVGLSFGVMRSLINIVGKRRGRYKSDLAAHHRAPESTPLPADFTEFFEDPAFKSAMADLKLQVPRIKCKILTTTTMGLRIEPSRTTAKLNQVVNAQSHH